MQIASNVIQQLNAVLQQQLTLINQNFLHARMLKNTGFNGLGGVFYKRSITQMKHADDSIGRILLLEGTPNLQDLGKPEIGKTPLAMVSADLTAEKNLHAKLANAILVCEKEQDYVSRKLLTNFKNDNEEQIDWLETQNELAQSLGLENYLQSIAE